MGSRLWRRARLLGSATAAALAGYSVLTLFAAPAAVVAGGCNTTPTADVAITQSSSTATVSAGNVTSVTFTVVGEDAGPCNAAGVTLSDTFSDSATPLTVSVVSVNPSSVNCPVTGQTVNCAPFKLSGPKDANTNNPGNVILVITVSGNFYPASGAAPPVSSVAQIAYAFDTTPGNNTSQGAFLIDGGDLGYPTDKSGQSTNLHVNPGQGSGGAEIEQNVSGPPCPSGVKCFGEVVLINASDILDGGGNPAIQTYTFDVPLAKGGPNSAANVVVLHEPDGTTSWVTVPPCTSQSPPTPDPCVASITKINPATGPSYFQVVVITEINGKWGM